MRRRTPWLRLSTEQLQAALAPAGWAGRLERWQALTGGLVNTNLRLWLRNPCASVVLRIYTRDPQACGRETRLLQLLQGTVPVPRALFVEPSADLLGHPYSLLEWIEGTPLDGLTDVAELERLWEALGETLGGLAAVRFAVPGFLDATLQPEPLGDDPVRAYAHATLFEGKAGTRLGTSLRDRLWLFAQASADLLVGQQQARQLVHGDCNPSNILVARTGDGWRVCALLDWEWAMAWTPLCDCGNLFRIDREPDAALQAAFARGYARTAEPLPENWQELSHRLDLLSALEFLDAGQERPHSFALARARIEATLQRYGG